MAGPDGETTVGVMPADAMAEWLRAADPVLLTDDYAPADNLDGADLPRARLLTEGDRREAPRCPAW